MAEENKGSGDYHDLLRRLPTSGSFEAADLAKRASESFSKTIWTSPKWTKEQLEDKTVEFRIPADGGVRSGIGKFWVRRNPAGQLAIELVTDVQGRNWAERVQTRYFIPQEGVDRVERHPDPSVADFQLFFL